MYYPLPLIIIAFADAQIIITCLFWSRGSTVETIKEGKRISKEKVEASKKTALQKSGKIYRSETASAGK